VPICHDGYLAVELSINTPAAADLHRELRGAGNSKRNKETKRGSKKSGILRGTEPGTGETWNGARTVVLLLLLLLLLLVIFKRYCYSPIIFLLSLLPPEVRHRKLVQLSLPVLEAL